MGALNIHQTSRAPVQAPFFGEIKMREKENSFTIFNALGAAAATLNSKKGYGQKRQIYKAYKEIITYLNACALAARVTVKIKAIFFDRNNDTLFIYTIKDGAIEYTLRATRTGLASFIVISPDSNKGLEKQFKKWLNFKLDENIPFWQACAIARQGAQNLFKYEKDAPVIQHKTGGENPDFTYMKPGTDAHIAHIDKQ